MNIEARLERIENAEKIRTLKAHYCDLCDEGYDADKLCELFTHDAVWDGGDLGCFEGRDQIHKFFTNMPKAMSFAIHHITNASVQVADDNKSAHCRWYLLQTATTQRAGQAIWLAGRYDDDLVLVDGQWKFEKVKLLPRFMTPFEDGWSKTQFVELGG